MKKAIGIVVLGLLWCNVGVAACWNWTSLSSDCLYESKKSSGFQTNDNESKIDSLERKNYSLEQKNIELESRIENLEKNNKNKKCGFRGRDLYGNCID